MKKKTDKTDKIKKLFIYLKNLKEHDIFNV